MESMDVDERKETGSVVQVVTPARRWGGLADTLRQNCTDLASIDASTAGLLQRLDQLAACTTLDAIASALRVFTKAERDYLMSPLLDEIYSSMTCEPIPVPPGQYTRARPPKGNALVRPVQAIATTDGSSSDAGPVVISPTCAIPVACMNGYDLALVFFFDRGGAITGCYRQRFAIVRWDTNISRILSPCLKLHLPDMTMVNARAAVCFQLLRSRAMRGVAASTRSRLTCSVRNQRTLTKSANEIPIIYS